MKADGATILYDDQCPLCVAQMEWLRRLDRRQRLDLLPLSDPRTALVAPQLSREVLLSAMHCVTPTGRVYRGIQSIRYICGRVPVLSPLGWMLWIPGLRWLAAACYTWGSRHRYRLSRGLSRRSVTREE